MSTGQAADSPASAAVRTGSDVYRGCVIVFGTLHGKEHQVAPAFADILGAQVIAAPGLDTDQFGTFTGDIPRRLSPLDAARAKARLAITATGHPYALASEASYGPLPGIGWPGHEEILLFLDDTRGLEILQGHRNLGIPGPTLRATSHADIAEDLTRAGWPGQSVIVRPAAPDAGRATAAGITKGITDPHQLAAAITAAAARSTDGHALIEPDLRAHHNPTRREVLTRIGTTLAARLATPCPACASPGYGRTGTQPGLPCADCGAPTDLAVADLYSCAKCPHQHAEPRPETTAEPRWCPNCNP